MRKARVLLHENVKTSLKAFVLSWKKLQLDYNIFIYISFETTKQRFCDVDNFHRLQSEAEVF